MQNCFFNDAYRLLILLYRWFHIKKLFVPLFLTKRLYLVSKDFLLSIDMSGYFRPCMFDYCDSVSQYLGIIAAPN